MTTVLQGLPETVDAHKHVQKQQRQTCELEDKLGKSQARLAALVAERDQLQRDAHQAAVSLAMGDKATAIDPARLVALDAEIVTATADEHVLRDALGIQLTVSAGVRRQVETDRYATIEATIRAALGEMEIKVRDVHTLNLQLATFAEQASGVLVPVPALLEMWLAQVRSLLGAAR